MLRKIKHPDHPVEGMSGMMMRAAAYTLVYIRPWLVPDLMGEVFHVPRWAVTETDQRTEERKWTAKKSEKLIIKI